MKDLGLSAVFWAGVFVRWLGDVMSRVLLWPVDGAGYLVHWGDCLKRWAEARR